jgi:ATP-dependent Zn protease
MALARRAHRHAHELLNLNRKCLDDLAASALERETLTREELDFIFDAHELHQPPLPDLDEALMELSDQA